MGKVLTTILALILFLTGSDRREISGFTFLDEESFSCGDQKHTLEIYRHEKTGLDFVRVPGGTFTMGSPSDESGRYDGEEPLHRVTVAPFLLCRTECTQKAWDLVGGEDHRKWRGENLPIEGVNGIECFKWCKNAGLRIPSEAEWEYACRAGTTTRFCFGISESELAEYAWYERNSGDKTHPVGSKKPNAFGLYDMHGNVWEFCQDPGHEDYTGAPSDGSVWSDPPSLIRIDRGGSWRDWAPACRSAYRGRCNVGSRRDYRGFRPACSIP